ncbi:dihydroxyacetone phosphate acyltransferase isoform X2 [Cimex lectularius]|uniref:Phospholipid/glycerol acyltransferase domain-containing protein n=1 Tax=Cimex lectularius TaxID=79782 RepID=A0A8I6RRS2_CIMLE|nr:dihydroxyacetone phosphate acyltransferase isoform X2 [Cimex lectularius]
MHASNKICRKCEKSNCSQCLNGQIIITGEEDGCDFDSSNASYTNILHNVQQTNDFLWATRDLNFQRVNISPIPAPSPKQLIQIVAKHVANKLQNQDMLTPDTVTRINQILNEIGYDFNLPIIRWLAWVLNRTLKSTLDGLYVSNVQALLANQGKSPVVLLPTHRSYADFILMAYIAFLNEIELPCVAAGMDFHAMFMMGSILRKCKAFYMKRRFYDDPLYKMVFNHYLRYLLIYGNSPVEFYIEGTRSRSGKTLPPKYGLLSTVVDSYLRNEVVDVSIVPAALVYDKIMEEVLFAHEHLGVPKPKESTMKLIKSLRSMNQKYGNVYVSFGNPISLRSFVKNNMDRENKNNPKAIMEGLTNLGISIIKRQKELSVVTVFNVVSIAVANIIIKSDQYATELETICHHVNDVTTILKEAGATLFIQDGLNLADAVTESVKNHNNLVTISKHGLVHFKRIYENVSLKSQGKSDYFMERGLMQTAIPRIMLQLYINPSMTYFSNPALLLAILQSKEQELDIVHLKNEFVLFNTTFKREFVNSDTSVDRIYNDALDMLERLNCIVVNGPKVFINRNTNDYVEILLNALAPFLAGYIYVIHVLLEIPEDQQYTNAELLKKVQYFIVSVHNEGNLKHPYALSLDLLGNALATFLELEVLIKRGGTPMQLNVNKIRALKLANSLDSLMLGFQLFSNINLLTCKL